MIEMDVEASPLQVEFSRHRLGLRVHVRGEETFENTVAYWRSIIEKLDGVPGRGLLLIDELRGTPLSEPQWLDLIVSMDGSRLRRFRIAHVRPRRASRCRILRTVRPRRELRCAGVRRRGKRRALVGRGLTTGSDHFSTNARSNT